MEEEADFYKIRERMDSENAMRVYLASAKPDYLILEMLSPNGLTYFLRDEGGWVPAGDGMFPVFGGNEIKGFSIQRICRLLDGKKFSVGDITKFGAIDRMVKTQDHYTIIVHTMTNKIVDFKDL